MHTISKPFPSIVPILFTLFFLLSTTAHAKMGSINGDKVQLRSGPGTKYSAKWEYGDGFPLKILSRKGSWVKVKDFENDTGWVYKKFVSSTPHMIVKTNKGKKKKINIRSGPGTNYKLVGQAYYGVVFQTLEQKKGWAKVKHDSGLTGWISRKLLWGF
ncbi:MAG: SH3 domain-containing protein [Thermodesulfobacteriota bacterium]